MHNTLYCTYAVNLGYSMLSSIPVSNILIILFWLSSVEETELQVTTDAVCVLDIQY